MNRIAWLITHDNYIDRRIFFFADVFKELGYEIRLFPSDYFDLCNDPDPLFVKRPVEKSLVKKYRISDDECPHEVFTALEQVIQAQEKFYQSNNKYAKSIRELGIRVSSADRYILRTTGFPEYYSVECQMKKEKYIYSSLTKEIKEILDLKKESDTFVFEERIRRYIKDYKSSWGNAFTIDGINVRSIVNEFGEDEFYAHMPSQNCMFCYNQELASLFRIDPIPAGNYGKDSVLERQFDYCEYKKIVYDYSPILKNITDYLKEERPDVVYVADLPTLPIGVMLKETCSCKLIIDCHEWWYKQSRLWEPSFERKIRMSQQYESELYKKCDLCITVGEYLASDMSDSYDKSFETIYSCLNTDLCVKNEDHDRLLWQRLFGLKPESKIVIFQGSMTTLRNLDNLARATRHLGSDQYLVVVGAGPYEPEFRKILQLEGKPEQVYFAGWVKQKDLMRYTANADLGVLPYCAVDEYFSYSVPNKLMEFFDAGIPMLYDVSMREISMVAGNHGVGIGEDLSDPERFGLKMRDLLDSPEMLLKMRNRYENYKDKFKYETQAKHFCNLLKKYDI